MKGLFLCWRACHGQENWPRIVNLRLHLAKLLDSKESFDLAFQSSITREKDQADFRFLHIQHFKTLEKCLSPQGFNIWAKNFIFIQIILQE